MSSVKLFTGSVLAGALASVLAIPTAAAQTAPPVSVIVNNETPLTVPSSLGFSYVAGSTTSTLSVYTGGFLFCTNVVVPGNSWNTLVTLAPLHLDQSFSPSHPWTLPIASDIGNIAYTGSELNINRNAAGALASTLVCHSLGANGEVARWLGDGIFDSGYDTATEENYHHLINWIPSIGFSWLSPDWTQVPTNPCYSSANQPARMVESAACAAATGVRPGSTPSVRAGTMWTATDGISFTYLFRVDVRFGAQPAGSPPAHFQVPTRTSTDVADATSGAYVSLHDGYDATYLGAAGSYCFLATPTLPTALNSSTCATANATVSNASGSLDFPFEVSAPPVGPGSSSFYVVMSRPVTGAHSNLATPVVGASILVDPALVAEGGDSFIGDDVIFGFMPTSQGFPWMNVTPP